MIIAVPKELAPGERRVALVPSVLQKLGDGVEVRVEAGAGDASGCPDREYEEAGAKIESDVDQLYSAADLVAKVRPPEREECARLRESCALVCALQPYAHLDVVKQLAERKIMSFALDLMPRITRAQSMDILSAMSTVAGYKAVLIAASALPRFFPLLHTAAGVIKPARVLILGAGVAGLQAIATARRLGALVEAFDIRAAAKEQVESLGARFVEQPDAEDAETAGGYAKEQTANQLAAQQRLLAQHIAAADVVICTALVPGRRAPVLMSEEQVHGMRPGSVIVDLAAEQGGNCALTRPGDTIVVNGIEIHGPLDVVSSMATDASRMFGRALVTYLAHLIESGELALDFEDELVSQVVVTREGKIVHPGVRDAAEG